MRRGIIVAFLVGIGAVAALWLLLQTPGSLVEALSHPLAALAGTGQQLNSTLLDFSQSPEPIRAASERLLQPLGIVRLVHFYRAPEEEPSKKKN